MRFQNGLHAEPCLGIDRTMLSGETASPFAKFGMVPMTEERSDGIRLAARRISVGRGHANHNAQARAFSRRSACPRLLRWHRPVSTHKPPSTLPTFAKEPVRAGGLRRPAVAKPDPEGTSHTTRPSFARPSAAETDQAETSRRAAGSGCHPAAFRIVRSFEGPSTFIPGSVDAAGPATLLFTSRSDRNFSSVPPPSRPSCATASAL